MKKIILQVVIIAACLTQTALAQVLYKTPSGKKYHLATCRMVENVSEKITLAKATDLGLEPCKICKPGFVDGASAPPKKAIPGAGITVQCKGRTKSGNRCKHMTSIANGYCFQHNPG